jgi:hypothetical protein
MCRFCWIQRPQPTPRTRVFRVRSVEETHPSRPSVHPRLLPAQHPGARRFVKSLPSCLPLCGAQNQHQQLPFKRQARIYLTLVVGPKPTTRQPTRRDHGERLDHMPDPGERLGGHLAAARSWSAGTAAWRTPTKQWVLISQAAALVQTLTSGALLQATKPSSSLSAFRAISAQVVGDSWGSMLVSLTYRLQTVRVGLQRRSSRLFSLRQTRPKNWRLLRTRTSCFGAPRGVQRQAGGEATLTMRSDTGVHRTRSRIRP